VLVNAASATRTYNATVVPTCTKRDQGDVACTVSIAVDEYTPIAQLSLQQVFADGTTVRLTCTVRLCLSPRLIGCAGRSGIHRVPGRAVADGDAAHAGLAVRRARGHARHAEGRHAGCGRGRRRCRWWCCEREAHGAQFEQQYYDDADLELFLATMGLPRPDPVVVIGPNDPSNPGTEGTSSRARPSCRNGR
jgi:hypothetical protein